MLYVFLSKLTVSRCRWDADVQTGRWFAFLLSPWLGVDCQAADNTWRDTVNLHVIGSYLSLCSFTVSKQSINISFLRWRAELLPKQTPNKPLLPVGLRQTEAERTQCFQQQRHRPGTVHLHSGCLSSPSTYIFYYNQQKRPRAHSSQSDQRGSTASPCGSFRASSWQLAYT